MFVLVKGQRESKLKEKKKRIEMVEKKETSWGDAVDRRLLLLSIDTPVDEDEESTKTVAAKSGLAHAATLLANKSGISIRVSRS